MSHAASHGRLRPQVRWRTGVTCSILALGATATLVAADAAPVPRFQSPFVVDAACPAPPGAHALRIAGSRLEAIRDSTAAAMLIEGVPVAPGVQRSLLLRRLESEDAPVIVTVVPRDDGALEELLLDDASIVASRGLMLAGIALGSEGSRVFLSIGPAGIFGFVQEGEARYIISSGRLGEPLPLLAFDPSKVPPDMLPMLDWTCDAQAPGCGDDSDAERGPDCDGAAARSQPCRQFRVAIETDHEFALLFNGQAQAAANYAQLLIAASSEIFTSDLNARLGATFLRLWLTPGDPWNASTPGAQLQQFRSHWNLLMTDVPRDIAHFLSGRMLGGGAAWTGTICGTNCFSLSGNLNGSFPYPLVDHHPQNWDIVVVTHEIAHNLGSLHTHQYGFDSPDSCFWGDCSGAFGGTIMSYCFLCPGGMANIVLTIAPICVNSMVTKLQSVSCSYSPPQAHPVAVVDFAVTATGIPLLIDVLANDAAANCDEVSLDAVTSVSAAGGTILPGPQPGQLLYVPPALFVGSDSFGYVLAGSGSTVGVGQALVQVNAIPPDLDGDGRVNASDLGQVLAAWGISGSAADLDGSGIVDSTDLGLVLASWTG